MIRLLQSQHACRMGSPNLLSPDLSTSGLAQSPRDLYMLLFWHATRSRPLAFLFLTCTRRHVCLPACLPARATPRHCCTTTALFYQC